MKNVVRWLPVIVIGLSGIAQASPEKISLHRFSGLYKATSCHVRGEMSSIQDLDTVNVKLSESGLSSISMRPKNSSSDWTVQFDSQNALRTEPSTPHLMAMKKRYTFKADDKQLTVKFTLCGFSSIFSYGSAFTCQKTSEEGVNLRTANRTSTQFQLIAFQKSIETNGKKFTIKCDLNKELKPLELTPRGTETSL